MKDKLGKEIHLRDTVEVMFTNFMGNEVLTEGAVVLKLEEDLIQVQIFSDNTMITVPSTDVTVLYSLIEEVRGLKTEEELQELMASTSARFNEALEEKPKRKKGVAKPKIQIELKL